MTQNRLARASSAYLQSASHQPIDWYEFGEEAFSRARELDRLILLDIGAVWCHWCHVIDRESYENDEIAQLINEHYVAVKVDRDQRPDIDARYQQVVASMTGQGGWPLTAFLTHDGRVLYGGTYFPPHVMKQLLTQLKDVYQNQKTEIMQDSLGKTTPEEIAQTQDEAEAEEAGKPIPADVFDRILQSARNNFDPVHGGFGIQPKFPHFSMLEFMMQQAYHSGDAAIHGIVEKSLTAMAMGGIYDHIVGGFHRYSVDREWHVPHFEKMAYDNAEALKIYARAYRLYSNPLYLQTVEGILDFTRDILSDPENGGFYASQDADIDLNDDGDHFTWTIDEVKAALTEEEARLVIACYDLTPEGDMHERPGRNVLRVKRPPAELAQMFNQPLEVLEAQLQSAKSKMAKVRKQRPMPFVDKTVYLNWNGMYLVAYFETADLLDRRDVREQAQKTLDRLLKTHVDAGRNRLLHTTGVEGMLEDYAWFIHALIKGYQSAGEKRYLEQARHWLDVASTLFEDEKYGGFFDIATPDENALALLKFRRKPTEDTPSSSANALMSRNLVMLYHLTGEERYHLQADKTFRMFGSEFGSRGIYISAMAIGLFDHLNPPARLEVVGDDPAFITAARQVFYPDKVVSYVEGNGKPEIRVCEGTRCLAPVTDPDALDDQLKRLVKTSVTTP